MENQTEVTPAAAAPSTRVAGRPRRRPRPPQPATGGPAELLRRWVDATGGSAAAVARALGISRQHLDRILTEDLRVTTEMAMRLAKWTGTSPLDWLNRQTVRDVQLLEADAAFMATLEDVEPWKQVELPNLTELRTSTAEPVSLPKRRRRGVPHE